MLVGPVTTPIPYFSRVYKCMETRQRRAKAPPRLLQPPPHRISSRFCSSFGRLGAAVSFCTRGDLLHFGSSRASERVRAAQAASGSSARGGGWSCCSLRRPSPSRLPRRCAAHHPCFAAPIRLARVARTFSSTLWDFARPLRRAASGCCSRCETLSQHMGCARCIQSWWSLVNAASRLLVSPPPFSSTRAT